MRTRARSRSAAPEEPVTPTAAEPVDAASTQPAPPSAPASHRLGDFLLAEAVVSREVLEQALVAQKASGLRLGEQLIELGGLDEHQLTDVLARQFDMPIVDMSEQTPDPRAVDRLSAAVARRLTVIPMKDLDGVLVVAVGDPRPGIDKEITEAAGAPIQLLAATPSSVRQAIERSYRSIAEVDRLVTVFSATESARNGGDQTRAESISSDAPVAQMVTVLVTQALRDRASDVHLEPSDGVMRVRFRIDGAMHDILSLPMAMSGALVSRIKILGGMNIVERRKSQDGQFTTEVDGRGIDVRVSTMATVWGEKCVMRILDKSRSLLRLDELGMPHDTHAEYSRMVRSPFGMILCAGPTGSGKTTTLYATLSEIDERQRNIVTIEDPVEYVMPSINQVQTNDQAGVGFADGLRAILRQDPDVILVGEIRDIDTARTAVQAALTGHFVLSSLHATDSVAALHRFLDMGIEAFLVASSVLGIVSQRLVRRICASCAEPYKPSAEEMAFYEESIGDGPKKRRFLRGRGCNNCAGTGYQDRIGVYEFLHVTPELRRLLVGWATQDELRRTAVRQGMRTLRDEGIDLVKKDVTTISEVIRSIYAL